MRITIIIIFCFFKTFGQKDSNGFYTNGKHVEFFECGSKFLLIKDSISNDTLEYSKLISKNISLCYIYDKKNIRYIIKLKHYYNDTAREAKRNQNRHAFGRTYYYTKSAKIISIKQKIDDKWKKISTLNIKPTYTIGEQYPLLYKEESADF